MCNGRGPFLTGFTSSNTIFHCFDIELTHEVDKGPFRTAPNPNAVVDEAFPETDGLDEGEFWRHFDEQNPVEEDIRDLPRKTATSWDSHF